MPCVLIGSCSLSLESALVVDLAQIGGAPRAREKAWPQAGCCGGKEGTSSWGGRCRGPRRDSVQSWHRVAGRGPRALPGSEPQAPLPVAMDGLGNEQPDCVEQGQTPVGGTPKGGGGSPLDECSQVVSIAQGPPLLESEWTAETGFRIREDTGAWREGSSCSRALANSGWGVGVGSLGCLLLLTQVA